jgi:hypothetical protein
MLGFLWTSSTNNLNKKQQIKIENKRKRMKKLIDPKNLLANIPEEWNLPKQRSELRKLYKRLTSRLERAFGLEVKLSVHAVKSDPKNMKEDERVLLENECLSLIHTLKTCIELHNLHTLQPPEE